MTGHQCPLAAAIMAAIMVDPTQTIELNYRYQ